MKRYEMEISDCGLENADFRYFLKREKREPSVQNVKSEI
jgi:hypothetical protein